MHTSNTKMLSTTLRLAVVVSFATISWHGGVALAQMPEVGTDGSLANPNPAPTAPAPVVVSVPNSGEDPNSAQEDDSGFYYDDGPKRSASTTSTVPETHVVDAGDTLWDICDNYFDNPWAWPKVWSYNSQITNPHWIYPGDKIRLREAGETDLVASSGVNGEREPDEAPKVDTPEARRARMAFRQLAFVSKEKTDYVGSIAGSVEGKSLLARGETVYLDYKSGKAPSPGQTFAVYEAQREIVDPVSGDVMGTLVRVVGEVQVRSVKKDKRARAMITDSTRVIVRGLLVGPVIQQFKNLRETPNDRDLTGRIIERLEGDKLIGQNVAVLINRGASHGLKAGNRIYAVRRGDEYLAPGAGVSTVGQDDRRYPARAIGELFIAEVSKTSALALVTASSQELEIGEVVVMRKSK